jgi:hypothetical protein
MTTATQTAWMAGLLVGLLLLCALGLCMCAFFNCQPWTYYSGVEQRNIPTNSNRWQSAGITPGQTINEKAAGQAARRAVVIRQWP